MAVQQNINIENTDHTVPVGKTSLLNRPHTAHPMQRNALGDIGNKVSEIKISDGNNKKGPVKKEIIQLNSRQQKILTKSKATTSLRGLAESNVVTQVCISFDSFLCFFNVV